MEYQLVTVNFFSLRVKLGQFVPNAFGLAGCLFDFHF